MERHIFRIVSGESLETTYLKKYMKMEKEIIIKFSDIEIEKQKFHQHKRPTLIKNIDINSIQEGGGQKYPPTSFSPATSTNPGVSP